LNPMLEFAYYTSLRLTLLYYKKLRLSLKLRPKIHNHHFQLMNKLLSQKQPNKEHLPTSL
ncbi:MAG: hypothetical protein ACYTX0_49885, partial [Nostoc sp.]